MNLHEHLNWACSQIEPRVELVAAERALLARSLHFWTRSPVSSRGTPFLQLRIRTSAQLAFGPPRPPLKSEADSGIMPFG